MWEIVISNMRWYGYGFGMSGEDVVTSAWRMPVMGRQPWRLRCGQRERVEKMDRTGERNGI